MILKTKAFQETANKILLAVNLDKTATNLELLAEDNTLFLRVTNREYYVSVKFALEEAVDFRATVDATLFLNLISGINTEEFELLIKNNTVVVKVGKSKYKLAMIYENDDILKLPSIKLEPDEINIEMLVSQDILSSILNINGKEVQKAKHLDVNELQRYYYIDETGCFTFTTGACINAFTLEKPIKLLLTDRVVKLFKLFSTDAHLSYGYTTTTDGSVQPIVIFQTKDIYVASRLLNDDTCIQKIKAPCDAMKNLVKEPYSHCLVISAPEAIAAVNRLLMFYKNSNTKIDPSFVPAQISITDTDFEIADLVGENKEVVTVENTSAITDKYLMGINLIDFKSVLDSCKNEHITLNCGNHKSIIISRGSISNVIAETQAKE